MLHRWGHEKTGEQLNINTLDRVRSLMFRGVIVFCTGNLVALAKRVFVLLREDFSWCQVRVCDITFAVFVSGVCYP
jgi:hypothetical protein